MFCQTICISSFEAAKRFINMTNRYMNLKINLFSEDYIIDAHSVMGILSLDMNKPVELRAEGETLNDFIKDIAPFAAA
ncbi:MAG: HPr family phosphocarrier protein [Oscillospiraceae bacterium]|jgi:phosphotransferase system HPr-like phosphotransfer protein|nr:HPr family phosphocarrier protein [Oscillospiraceae bacterium]